MAGILYESLAEVARFHGVKPQAITGWKKKSSWPIADGGALDKEKIDAFVRDCVAHHRRGENKKLNPVEAVNTLPPDLSDVAPTLAQLEDRIRRSTITEEAERLSKQIRSLKVLQEVQEREGRTINADRARGEIEAALTVFQTTLMGRPKNMSGALVGVTTALEVENILVGWFTEILAELRRGLESAITPESEIMEGRQPRTNPTGEAVAEPVGREVQDSDA